MSPKKLLIAGWANPVLLGLGICCLLAALLDYVVHHIIFVRPDTTADVSFDVSPGGTCIAFSALDGNIYSVDLIDGDIEQITDGAGIELGPSFTPDGRSVLYASTEDSGPESHLRRKSLDSGVDRLLTSGTGTYDGSPSMSRDGSKIVFVRAQEPAWDQVDIYVLDVASGMASRVTIEGYFSVSAPRFVGSSHRVIYSARLPSGDPAKGDGCGLWTVDLDAVTAPLPVGGVAPSGARMGAWGSEPTVSPDGSRIAFVSDRGIPYHYDILVSAVDGTAPIGLDIALRRFYNQGPRYSPDGEAIFYLTATAWTSDYQSIMSLWRVPAGGGTPEEVVGSGLLINPRAGDRRGKGR